MIGAMQIPCLWNALLKYHLVHETMITIRPHRLFNLVTTSSYEARLVKMVLPNQRTPMLLDTAILLALAKLIEPRSYFEFGTFLGIQLLNLAANLPECRVYTMDLDEESAKSALQDENDRPLTMEHLNAKDKLAFVGSSLEKRITYLRGDSNNYDFSSLQEQMDMIYIDGGHDERTLKSDTANAFKMLSRDRASCIVWHDYLNPAYPQVTSYLQELSKKRDIFAVEETWLAFFLHGAKDLVNKLKA
jgi:predicted O-methyltransferase YrrM